MRLAAYAGASAALATGVVLKAMHQRSNFYSACVYLSQSSANLMILTNLCLLITGYVLFWLQRLLYGPLRPIETEQLYERAWFAVTETCLAMTIFRGSLGAWFLVMFVSLLVGKVWSWIGEGRVEFLEQQPPANPRLFHTRLAISLALTVCFHSYMLEYCIKTVLEQARPDMMVMFGFEFAVLTILSSSTTARYAIALVEILITRKQIRAKLQERRAEIRAARDEIIREHARAGATGFPSNLPDENDVDELELDVPGWEDKGRWVFYLDLLTDFLKLVVYLSFFVILFTFYGLPIHILRDVVVTIRSFGRRIMDFFRYRNATRDMNQRYPDATSEEVSREDVCIICREEMTPWNQPAANANANNAAPRNRLPERRRPKKLPCGHILHFACLRSWLERQQNCPTCRRPVLGPAAARGHPGNAVGGGGDGQANAGVGAQQNIPGQNGGAPDGLARARIYQFGPFRLGFGAGRGDLLQNLQRQIHQGNVPVQAGAGNNNINNVNMNDPDVQQLGFGLGFGRAQPTPTVPSGPNQLAGVQMQLQQIELQLLQEINNLRVTAEQLHVVRLLQAELQRLRGLQADSSGVPATGFHNITSSSASSASPLPSSFTTTTATTTSSSARRQFFSDPNVPALRTGDERLPEGLNLPPGWTLVPLRHLPSRPAGTGTTPGLFGATPTETTTQQTEAETPTEPDNLGQPDDHEQPEQEDANQVTPEHAYEARSNSPSQEWTDVTPDSSEQTPDRSAESTPSDGSKGKSRVPTVEEAEEEP
ncbi:hypothetical protein ASPZODRAFT_16653 [Penicilliopsis zonata CBS 506.65]|uniref:RING-type E3 ubiquitin transferase n=1 Tax=Penicilliopsis zonata CBS 506.65 TaxID=1073090 RepID=A0A1L9SG06_9EURO|nr:hypothetical protein ASPZODRAFT_16653 [Penicilliopsis zonata CBS 506.65]OJJ46058.1 hypothetical protein ASPZODRAFT_16653 [Penicilliopsis zonata CBS 506.65]